MIVLGADVGKNIGLCVISCVGHDVQFVEARTEIADTLPLALRQIVLGYMPNVVGVESPTQVFEHGRASKSKGARIGIERALLQATRATGVIQAVVQLFSSAYFCEAQAHEIRRKVLGKLPRSNVDVYVRSMVPQLIRGWPARSNDHARDAAVAALWARSEHLIMVRK